MIYQEKNVQRTKTTIKTRTFTVTVFVFYQKSIILKDPSLYQAGALLFLFFSDLSIVFTLLLTKYIKYAKILKVKFIMGKYADKECSSCNSAIEEPQT